MRCPLAALSLWSSQDTYELENLEIKAPLVLDDEGMKLVRTEILSNTGDLVIKSRARLSDDDFTVHVTARIVPKAYSDKLYDINLDTKESNYTVVAKQETLSKC